VMVMMMMMVFIIIIIIIISIIIIITLIVAFFLYVRGQRSDAEIDGLCGGEVLLQPIAVHPEAREQVRHQADRREQEALPT
jgi:flagellar basal body-associated protein FliL